MMERRHQLPREENNDDPGEARMGFLDHLEELRTRLIRSCVAVAVGMLVAFIFVDRIADFVLAPIQGALPPGSSLVFLRPGEGFSFYLDISLITGILLAAPFVMYQVWKFIAPALYANEKKLAVPFVVLTSAGSLCGALFSQYVLFPALMKFFAAFNSSRMKFMPGVDDTVDLYLKMMVGMVVVFQIPTLVFFLAKMRLVTAQFLWRNIKYAILIIFIIAAILTPSTDPWNQTVFALPMIGLYLISIGIAWMVGRTRGQEASRQTDSAKLRLVIGAMVIDQARKHHRRHGDSYG